MTSSDSEFIAYLLTRFETSGAYHAFAVAHIYPAFAARKNEILRREQTEQRERDKAERLADMAEREKLRGEIRTAELARRTEIRQAARKNLVLPNKRFCDLDDSPLSDRQVVMRANAGQPAKEIETGRIMKWQDEPQYGKGKGRWIEVATSRS